MKKRVLLTAAAMVLGLVSACGSDKTQAQAPPQPSAEPITPISLAITPATGAGGVPVAAEIGIALSGGTLTSVKLLKADDGSALAGDLRDDQSSWVPATPLAYNTSYQAEVTAVSEAGEQAVATTSFTTMGRAGHLIYTGLYLFDGQTVGVATPVAVEFDEPIAPEARAEIQKRLFVETDPPQPGVWHWPADGRQAWYRAPDYWKPGTKITVRSALEGQPMGGDAYGDKDRTATVTVGDKVFMDVDNASKQMYVYINDQFARAMPVSLGKPSTPSSSGFMVLMSKQPTTTFDTRGEPNGGYVVDVDWAMRLTWGGEFIHSAPWSVYDQGRTNVSHGCVNLAPENARWLFDVTHVGDPIIVRGTEETLTNGNGWTAWNIPWSEYVAGSALPVPEELAKAPAVDHVTGVPPTPTVPVQIPGMSSEPAQTPGQEPAQTGPTPTPVVAEPGD